MSFARPTVVPQASVNFTECLEMLVLSWLPRRSGKRGCGGGRPWEMRLGRELLWVLPGALSRDSVCPPRTWGLPSEPGTPSEAGLGMDGQA